IPIPPDCKLDATGLLQLLKNLQTCKLTRAHCEALPNHKVVTAQSGNQYCVPRNRPPNCEGKLPLVADISVKIPNLVDSDCLGTPIRYSADPNDKSGPPGRMDARFLVVGKPLSYDIQFENKPSATAPAQVVAITDQLDAGKVNL